jgi:tetratricopeptide (TPR) repeat protein
VPVSFGQIETTAGTGSEAFEPCSEGERLFLKEHHQDAEPLLVECLESHGEQADPLIFLTVIAVTQNRLQAGLDWGKRAVQIAPDSPDARYWYGRALVETGDQNAARQEWEQGLAHSLEHLGLLEGLAKIEMAEGYDEKAYGLLNQLQRLGVQETWVHQMLAELAQRKGLWQEALTHWRSILENHGETGHRLLRIGELSILAGDLEGAIAACHRAVVLDSTAEAFGGLGEALFAGERHRESLGALHRAVQLDPDMPVFRFNLANVLEILGQVEEAEVHFRRYLDLVPDDPIGHLNFGIHLEKLGRNREAVQQVQMAVKLNPSLLSAQVVYGQLLAKMGHYRPALGVIDTLLTRDPENRDALQAWRDNVAQKLAQEDVASAAGQVRLLHIVTADSQAVALIREELQRGVDFTILASRYSSGPAAAKGGDIGWVAPADMIEPMRSVIEALNPDEVSPPVRSGGLYHLFKRVR